MTVELPRKIAHAIRLERDGYSTALKLFTLVSNEKSQNFIRFGLSEDLGYYLDLEPSAMKAKMRNKLVPYSVGADSFEKMALCVLQADERLENGEISPMEHKYLIKQILDFFRVAELGSQFPNCTARRRAGDRLKLTWSVT